MTATTIRVQMAQRKDTAANWTAANPILLSGEVGYETDTKKFKIGDGTTNWNSVAYLPIPDGSGNLTITGNLEIGTTGSLTFEGSTANGFETTLAVTDPTADRTITLPNVSGTVVTTGDTGSVTSTMIADGTIVNADISGSAEIAVSKLANGTANQVIVTDGTNVSWSDNLTLAGDLTVNGTTTTINTQDLLVEDKNIIIGNVATPTDLTADGGGITLKGSTDKTINWVDSTDAWTLSENVNIASGKEYRIDGTKVLDGTSLGSGVVSSSLTSVGTIGTGVWQGTAIDAAYLDSTIVTTGDTGTVTSAMLADGAIVNADVNASAAIAGTKISPDFGSQNVTTTGTATAAALIPSGSSVPTNGVYLPSANNVAISTNGTGRLFVNSSGNVGIGSASPLSSANYSTLTIDGTNGGQIAFRENGVGNKFIYSTTTDLEYRNNNTGAQIWYTSGNERMRLDSSGRLGLGTSVPGATLEVTGSSYPNFLSNRSLSSGGSGAAAWTAARIQATTTEQMSAGFGVQQEFALRDADGVDNTVASLLVLRDGADNSGSFAIRTASAGTLGTRLHITSGGSVGIGVAAPQAPLDVFQAASGAIARFTGNGNTSTFNGFQIEASGTLNRHLRLISGGSQVFRAYESSTGNVATDSAIAFDSSAQLFRSPDGTSERARIDSSGRLLVGTSSTSRGDFLQVQADSGSTTNGGSILLRSGKATGTITTGDVLGQIRFSDSSQDIYATIQAVVDGSTGSNDFPSRLVFSTTADGASSPTERMRVNSSGGTYCISTDSIALGLSSTQTAGTTFYLIDGKHSGTAGSVSSGTRSFRVFTNGNVENTNNSYAGLSDAKLKENIVDASSQWDDLKALQVRNYNFKEETGQQTHTQIGLVAQEVELVSPGLVSESPDRDAEGNDLGTVTKSVNYSVLYMKAVKALQEAMERIETLEAKVAALEGV
jgi:hypothetical protein